MSKTRRIKVSKIGIKKKYQSIKKVSKYQKMKHTVVKFEKECHGRELSSPKGRELVMFFPRESEEGITTIHEITVDQSIRVGDGWKTQSCCLRTQSNHEENFLVLLHSGINLRCQVIFPPLGGGHFGGLKRRN